MKLFRYSTISDFYKCPRFYKLKHIDGLDDGLGKNGDIVFGTAIHMGIEDLLSGGDGLDVFNMFWGMQESKGLEYGRYGHDVLGKMGREMLVIFRDEQMKHFQPLALEQKLTAPLGRHVYSGTIDFTGTFKGKASVVDWKTSAMPYDRYKLPVGEQLPGYNFLAKQNGFAAEQMAYVVFIKDPANPRIQIRLAPVTEAEQTEKLGNIEAACDAITASTESGVFLKNPTQCVRGKQVCAFYSACHEGAAKDGGSKEETGEEA